MPDCNPAGDLLGTHAPQLAIGTRAGHTRAGLRRRLNVGRSSLAWQVLTPELQGLVVIVPEEANNLFDDIPFEDISAR